MQVSIPIVGVCVHITDVDTAVIVSAHLPNYVTHSVRVTTYSEGVNLALTATKPFPPMETLVFDFQFSGDVQADGVTARVWHETVCIVLPKAPLPDPAAAAAIAAAHPTVTLLCEERPHSATTYNAA